jgi:hypothetical protein
MTSTLAMAPPEIDCSDEARLSPFIIAEGLPLT